jgi:hypothetical protein
MLYFIGFLFAYAKNIFFKEKKDWPQFSSENAFYVGFFSRGNIFKETILRSPRNERVNSIQGKSPIFYNFTIHLLVLVVTSIAGR